MERSSVERHFSSTLDEISPADESDHEARTTNEDETTRLLAKPVPIDHYHKNFLVFYLLGMGTLLPWNFFISVSSFWDYKFRDVNATNASSYADDGKTELQKEFTSYLAIASNVPNALFVILSALFGQRIKLKYRIFASLSAVIVLFFIMLALAKTNSDAWQREFLEFVLVLVVLVNCCTAIFQGALFGVAGKFPARYMGAVMAGQAMGGIFPAVVDILVTMIRVKEKDIGFASFLIATLVLLASFLSFSWVRQTAFFKFYTRHDDAAALTSQGSFDTGPSERSSILSIFKSSWHYCLSLYLVFATTLSVFPAVTVLITSEFKAKDRPSEWPDRYFTPVTCFLLFNCGDYAGRFFASWLRRPRGTRVGRISTVLLSVARVAFIPVFMLCNAAPTKRSLPVYFGSDLVYIFFMVVFSVSNGYLGNLCMMHGPKTFASSEDQELSAMVLVACLVLGTGTGSFLSYPIVSLL